MEILHRSHAQAYTLTNRAHTLTHATQIVERILKRATGFSTSLTLTSLAADW